VVIVDVWAQHAEYAIAGYEPGFFDRYIVEIAFFHSLVIIQRDRTMSGRTSLNSWSMSWPVSQRRLSRAFSCVLALPLTSLLSGVPNSGVSP
jgi:hypothetical protein